MKKRIFQQANTQWLKNHHKRIIGNYTHHQDGPLLIVMGAIHGNEPAGVKALQAVLNQLKKWKLPILGEFIGLVGNLRALSQQKRYLKADLNRQWGMENVIRIQNAANHELLKEEDLEQKELLELLTELLPTDKNRRRVVLLDLHTTSAEGVAYTIATSIGASRTLAENLGVPVILDLDRAVSGTTLNYFSEMELESFCFEAGQHDDEDSVRRTVSAIWQMLVHVGCIESSQLPLFDEHKTVLHDLGKKLARTVRYKYRHAIQPRDRFRMIAGFDNFQPIQKGQLLAHDREGAVYAPFSGIMLMPLYQAQGKDGFFIVEEV
ncbi:MAG: succinylglutamate desuccinylase/aspartoacylase family protein [Chitinophagales bacterium]